MRPAFPTPSRAEESAKLGRIAPRGREGAFVVIASEAKHSIEPQDKNGLLRRGACHRARVRASRWLLAMTAPWTVAFAVSPRDRSNPLIWRAFHQSFHIAGNKFNSVEMVDVSPDDHVRATCPSEAR